VDLNFGLADPVIIVNSEDDPSGLPVETAVNALNISSLSADELANTALTLPMLAALVSDQLPLQKSIFIAQHRKAFTSATLGRNITNAWLVNGQYQPYYEFAATEWVLFDLVVASGSRIIELELIESLTNMTVASAQTTEDMETLLYPSSTVCTLQILALDGIYLTRVRTWPFNRHLPLLQGSRATVAVMCSTPGEYYLATASVVDDGSDDLSAYVRIGKPATKSIQNILTLVVNEQNLGLTWAAPPSDLSSIPRPLYLSTTFTNNSTETQYLNKNTSSSVSNGTALMSFKSSQVWSIGLDQRGCCSAADGSAIVSNLPATADALSSGQVPLEPRYWMGVGRDCTLTCFDDYECLHFYGADYGVLKSPSVLLNKCAYWAYNYSNYNASNSGSTDTVFKRVSTSKSVEQISVWSPTHDSGTLQFLLQPVQVFSYSSLGVGGRAVEAGPYRNVGDGIGAVEDSTIVVEDFDEYGNVVIDSGGDYAAFFGEVGDWRDVLPVPLGRVVVHARYDIEGANVIRSGELFLSDSGYRVTANVTRGVTSTVPSSNTTKPDSQHSEESPLEFVNVFSNDSYYSSHCDFDGLSSRYVETIDVLAGTRTITTNSCPSHFSLCQESGCAGPNMTRAEPYIRSYVVPLFPSFSSRPLDNGCAFDGSDDGVGIVAVALNGVAILAPGDGVTAECQTGSGVHPNRQPYPGITACDVHGDGDGVLWCGDAVQKASSRAIDKCGGQTDKWGRYSYRIPPICLIQELDYLLNVSSGPTTIGYSYNQSLVEVDAAVVESAAQVGNISATTMTADMYLSTDAVPSPQIGWALDGFPVMGPFGPLGVHMKPCHSAGAHPTICLDECNGLMGEFDEYDNYLYRYLTMSCRVLDDEDNSHR
jgi:hypothetical protein